MNIFDLRFYRGGWRIGVGPFFARYNREAAYREFGIGQIRSRDFHQIGGMTWKQWRQAKRDAAAAAAAKQAEIAAAQQAEEASDPA